jgi:hypothetical protein
MWYWEGGEEVKGWRRREGRIERIWRIEGECCHGLKCLNG